MTYAISIRSLFAACFAMLLAGSTMADVPRPRKDTEALPGPWADASPQDRLAAIRVAQLDALRQLAERIYGMQVSAGTTVADFALASDVIDAKMQAVIRGAAETSGPEYTEDGIVMVVYGVQLRTVIETLKAEINSTDNGELKTRITYKVENEDQLVEALGNGALKTAPGMQMIRAKRAAEVDAYRRMAERVVGVKLTSESTVREFCLKNDRIVASVAASLRGLKPTDIVYKRDNSCEVTMQLTKREVLETMKTIVRRYAPSANINDSVVIKINREVKDTTFTVVGRGAPNDTESLTTQDGLGIDEPMEEEIAVLKRVISSSTVIE